MKLPLLRCLSGIRSIVYYEQRSYGLILCNFFLHFNGNVSFSRKSPTNKKLPKIYVILQKSVLGGEIYASSFLIIYSAGLFQACIIVS
jgi:hypothetical protein